MNVQPIEIFLRKMTSAVVLVMFSILLINQSYAQCPTSGTITTNCTQSGNWVITGNTVVVNPGVTVTVTGDITIRGNANVSAGSGAVFNVSGNFNETYGTLNEFSGGTLNLLNGTSNFSTGNGSSFTLTSTAVVMNGGNLTLNSETQTLANSTFTGVNTFSSNATSLVITNSSITTSGNFSFRNGDFTNATLIAGGKVLVNSGASTMDNSTIEAGAGNTAPATGTLAFEFNGGGTLVASNGSTIDVTGDWLNNDITVDASDVNISGDFDNAGNEQVTVRNGGTFNVEGDFNNSGSGDIVAEDGGTIDVGGNFDNTGGGTVSAADGGLVNVGGDFDNTNGTVDTNGGAVAVDGGFTGDTPTGDGSGCSGGGGSCCGSAATCGSLPVDLVYFIGSAQRDRAFLEWKTSSETDNDFFTIEISENGIDFQELTKIKGNGTTQEEKLYSYSFVLEQNTYVRLKQTDYDGKNEYKKTIHIKSKINDGKMVSVFPTIIPNGKDVRVNGVYNSYEVYNEVGILCKSGYKVSLLDLKRGLYIIKFRGDNFMENHRVIIQ